MTKKHFEAIARILRESGNNAETQWIAKELADYFVSENVRFDRARFMNAAGF